MKTTKREKDILHVTIYGGIVNVLLLVFKFVAGVMGQSSAMLADAVHSLSDFATDVVVLFFVRFSGKPQDKDHGYGHGKYETLATAVIGAVLLVVGLDILWSGVENVVSVCRGATLPEPGMLAFWAAVVSILLKEITYQITARVGKKVGSQAVIANAWHHRSDVFSSIGTALGIGGAIVLGEEWHVLDPIAAVVVSIFIIKVAVQLLRPCIDELTEKSLSEEIENEIEQTVLQIDGVSEVHNLRTRRIGSRYAIEMHVRMAGSLTLLEAHEKSSRIERELKAKYGSNTHVGIHVEPVKVNGVYALNK